jgi:ABC-type multidrug transport system ATPase subunit
LQQANNTLQLEIVNIGKRYQNQWLFRHINLSLKTGDRLSVTGRNGSGKSTLMQIIYGLIQASEGEVRLDGKTAFDAHRTFALTSPYMELPMEFSIRELHDLYLKTGKLNKTLSGFLEYSAFTRLKTALCLCSDAPVLLLDEPLSNMDHQGEIWYKNCVADIQDRICIVAGNNPEEYAFTNANIHIGAEHQPL